jgi:signal peptidase I
MKKIFKLISYFLLALLGVIIIGRITNSFQYYKSPTIANEPTFQVNTSMLGSKLINPKRLDFIWFMGETPFGRNLNLYRLCGHEGDTFEVRNGNLFVNSKDIDLELKLSHNYLVSNRELENIKSLKAIDLSFVRIINNDTVSIPLPDEFVKENNISAIRLVYPSSFKDTLISSKYNKPWNLDNFGPIVVPQNNYFVLGDNRHNAQDSRYKGFIAKADFSSTIFWRE